MKSYPTVNQPGKFQSSVILGHQFSGQGLMHKSSPSLPDGLYCAVKRNDNRTFTSRLIVSRRAFRDQTTPYYKAGPRCSLSLPVILHYSSYVPESSEKDLLFQDGIKRAKFNTGSLEHKIIEPTHTFSEKIPQNRVVSGQLL